MSTNETVSTNLPNLTIYSPGNWDSKLSSFNRFMLPYVEKGYSSFNVSAGLPKNDYGQTIEISVASNDPERPLFPVRAGDAEFTTDRHGYLNLKYSQEVEGDLYLWRAFMALSLMKAEVAEQFLLRDLANMKVEYFKDRGVVEISLKLHFRKKNFTVNLATFGY